MPIESRLLAGPVPASLLVVDDEPQVRTVLKDALGESGFSVDVAADAESQILKARTTPYDVAICDLKMPGIDGLRTIWRIPQINPHIQFISQTAPGTPQSATQRL